MSKFLDHLDQISNNLIPHQQDPVVTNRNFYSVLNEAIRSWIQLLQLNNQEQQLITLKNNEKFTFNLAKDLFFLWKPEQGLLSSFTGSGNNSVYAYAQRFLNWRNTDTKIITLIAFIIVAFRYCMYLINSSQQFNEINNNDNNQAQVGNSLDFRSSFDQVSLDYRNQIPNKTIVEEFDQSRLHIPKKAQNLLLAIPAQKERFIKDLKLKGQIDYEDSGTLYELCEYLLLLNNETDLEFKWNQLQNKFASLESSEHDIYLAQIRLSDFDPRFQEDVNQLDRYDAFRELTGLKIDLSSRLRVEVYHEFDFYKR